MCKHKELGIACAGCIYEDGEENHWECKQEVYY
jgi:hypothetical protein